MAKSQSRYVCQSCGAVHPRWAGQCDTCHEWNTLVEERVEQTPKGLGSTGKAKQVAFEALASHEQDAPRIDTAIGELNRVLGGGLVLGSAVLVGGDPGIGKSTLLLQAVCNAARQGVATAYISGEESTSQIQLRARRLGLAVPGVELAAATSVRDILASLDKSEAKLVVIDSVQTMFLDNIEAAPGTVSQVRGVAHELIKYAKRRNIALFLVGHVTKDGQIAGPRVMEHMVDTVLYFEGDRGHQFRILRAVKNRFGATDEIGVFAMGEQGLSEVANPSSLFLPQREQAVSGSVVFAGMEGSRPLLVEIQALVTPSGLATPRRAVVGWDSARLAMVLAVLEARADMVFHDKEVFLNIAGGFRVNEPAADLAAACALVSALLDKPFPAHAIAFGEISLSGEVRPVGRSEQRLKEAQKLGFTEACFAPAETNGKPLQKGVVGCDIRHVEHIITYLRT